MEPVIDYSRLPEAYRAILVPLFEEFAIFLPPWMSHVTVSLRKPEDEEEKSRVAECITQEYYRMASIRFYPAIMSEPSLESIRHAVLHEIKHCIQQSYHDLAIEATECISNKEIRRFYQDKLGKAREAMTEDDCYSTLRYIDNRNKND